MIIVSNTSPLVCLLHLNKINLLKDLFANVIIPTAVFNELNKAKSSLIDRIQTEIKFRINNKLLQKILIEANEL